MLFGLEKRALLLVFVLLLARTAHFETFARVRENRMHSSSYSLSPSLSPGTAQLGPGHLIWRLSSAKLNFEVLRRGSCPLIPFLHSNTCLCCNAPFPTPLVSFTAAGTTS